jgi:short-subunit dehydrogenase
VHRETGFRWFICGIIRNARRPPAVIRVQREGSAMRIKLKPLAEQVVLITGASSGIGLVTARTAAARGAKVMLVARNEAALEEAVRSITAEGGTAAYAVADVGDAEQVRAAGAAAIARFGRIDSWVNNAGVAIYAKLVDTPLDEHERMFRTNYFGAVNGAMTAIALMRESGGALITVASIASDLPSPILGAYAASKHAIKAYVESLRIELRADAVPLSLTLIKPAGIDTPIGQHAANHMPGEAMIPPPAYDPQLVADAILDAAERPRREITVGGAGRAQVLFGEHFPALLERLAPLTIPGLFDRSKRRTPGSDLFAAGTGGHERSGILSARRTSLYTTAQLHPGTTTAIGIAAAAGIVGIIAARRLRGTPTG